MPPLPAKEVIARCEHQTEIGKRHAGRFGDLCPLHNNASNHCGHGDPVRCCTCGAYKEPLLDAMQNAIQDT